MSRFAGAVHIVATDGAHGRRGVTVSAATSVSDNPPTLLFCLNSNRAENQIFEKNGVFSLNTLCASQIAIARAFAGEGQLDMDARFAKGVWVTHTTGAPLLNGARVSLDCKVSDVRRVATHDVIFGEAVGFHLDHDGPALPAALLYADRNYRVL